MLRLFRDCFIEEIVDFVKSLESKIEIYNTLYDTEKTFSNDKLIYWFDNKYLDILNFHEW